jgi:hypothetical protein
VGGTPYRKTVVVMLGLVHEVPVTVVWYSHVSFKVGPDVFEENEQVG